MQDSLIYANSIEFHNKSEVIFSNTFTSQEIVNRTKNKLKEMIECYSQKLSIDIDVYMDWGSGCQFRITIINNTNEKINGWEFVLESEKRVTACWDSILTDLGNDRYSIKNKSYNGIIDSGQALTIEGQGDGGMGKISVISTTCW